MKNASRKLVLNRETIATLTETDLDGVHGGNVIQQSSDMCASVVSAIVKGTFDITTKFITRPRPEPKPPRDPNRTMG